MAKKSQDAAASDAGLKAKLAKTFLSLRGGGKVEKAQNIASQHVEADQTCGSDHEKRAESPDIVVPKPTAIPRPDGRATSKHDHVVCLLSRKEGATIDDMVAATGWQKHTVRGFLSGQVKGKLKLNLLSQKTDRGRIYQVLRDADLTEAGHDPKK